MRTFRSVAATSVATLVLFGVAPGAEAAGGAPAAAPVAEDAAVATYWRLPVEVTFNASDADGDALTFTATDGDRGRVAVSGNVATYRPRPRLVGTDVFTYTVSDGQTSDTATVTVEVTRRRVVTATTGLVNRDGGNDRVTVRTTPAVATSVTIFRINRRGDPVAVGQTRTGRRGIGRLTIVDSDRRGFSAYYAGVAGTSSTRPARTPRAQVR